MIQIPAIAFEKVLHLVMHSKPARRNTVTAAAVVGRSLSRIVNAPVGGARSAAGNGPRAISRPISGSSDLDRRHAIRAPDPARRKAVTEACNPRSRNSAWTRCGRRGQTHWGHSGRRACHAVREGRLCPAGQVTEKQQSLAARRVHNDVNPQRADPLQPLPRRPGRYGHHSRTTSSTTSQKTPQKGFDPPVACVRAVRHRT
jgi:hypothetical protein